jgi:hypothetical protein
MKKKILAITALLCVAQFALAQASFLVWTQAPTPAEGPDGNPLGDGFLAQLIVTTTTAPAGSPPALDLNEADGLTGTDALVPVAAGGATLSGGNPNTGFGGFVGDIGAAGLTSSSVIWARIFNAPPASMGTGDIPTPTFDAGQAATGVWYADMPVVQIVPDLSPVVTVGYTYSFDVDQADWQFAAAVVPEPSALALMGIGLLTMLWRRRIR